MPVNAVGIVSLLSYALTFVKGNALEMVSNLQTLLLSLFLQVLM